jgi:hypothetical protein
MKSLTIIFAFLIVNIAIAQNLEPSVRTFKYLRGTNDTILIKPSADDTLFKQNKMLLGWHWGSDTSMSQSLGCTQAHLMSPFAYDSCLIQRYGHIPAFTIAKNVDLILNIPYLWHDIGFNALWGQQIVYEPTLLITNPWDFNIRDNDFSDSVFGFPPFPLS